MEEQRLGVGVVEEVDELLFEVAVVDVDGHRAELERAEQAFDVLVRVVEVRRDLRVGAEAGGRNAAARRAARSSSSRQVRTRSPWMSAVWSGSASPTDSKIEAKFQSTCVSPSWRRASASARRRGAVSRTVRFAAMQRRGAPRGGRQRIPRPHGAGARRSARPGPRLRRRPAPVRSRSPRSGAGSSTSRRRAIVPELPADFPVERRASAVLVAAVRGGRRGPAHPHEAARDDADAPGRDRVPRRQARADGRRRPARRPRCARRTRRSGSTRPRSRSSPSSTASAPSGRGS